MRLNRFGLSVLAFVSLLFLFCGEGERSDVITGVGDGMIDPTLIDVGSGFMFMSIDSQKVISGFSIPGAANTKFSTQTASWFMAGVNERLDTLRANFQFYAANGASKYSSTDTLVGAYLYFRAIGSDTTSKGTINVFSSEERLTQIPASADGETKIGEFTLDGSIDSVKFDDTLAELADSIFKIRTSKTADTLDFAFSILDYYDYDGVRKINNPYVILYIKKAGSSKDFDVRDSIPADLTFFTAFENRDSIAVRADRPYSSSNTLRTAVFQIDIGDIIDTAQSFDSRTGEVINAALSFKHNKDSVNYKIVLSDKLLTGKNDTEALQKLFSNAVINRTNKKGNAHSVVPFVRNAVNNSNRYLYVYLRPTSDHSVIVWNKSSIKVDAVLTPSRSR